LVGILVEDKKDVSAFANYKDESGASAPPKPQEKKPEVKVEATTTQTQQTSKAHSSNSHTGRLIFFDFK